ncbi:hypothetical protein VDGL01_07350 [Verticillium dahliae]
MYDSLASSGRVLPELPHLDNAGHTANGPDDRVVEEPVGRAPVHRQGRPRHVPHEAPLPRGLPLLVLRARRVAGLAALPLDEQPSNLKPDVGRPRPRAPARGLDLLRRRQAEDALAAEEVGVLERLEQHERDELRPGNRLVERLGARVGLGARLLVDGLGLRLLLEKGQHEAAAGKVYAQQAPGAQEDAALAQQQGQGAQPRGEAQGEGRDRGGLGRGGEEQGRALGEGKGEGDELVGGAVERRAAGGVEKVRREAGRVADEEEYRVDARRGLHATVEVGNEGVNVGGRRGEDGAEGQLGGSWCWGRRGDGLARGQVCDGVCFSHGYGVVGTDAPGLSVYSGRAAGSRRGNGLASRARKYDGVAQVAG